MISYAVTDSEENMHHPHLSLLEMPIGPHLDLSHLNLDSTVADLPNHHFQVSPLTPGEIIAYEFDRQPNLPGVIVIEGDNVLGSFSRRKFLERVGRPYGVEVYLKRPVRVMLRRINPHHLVLPANSSIHTAVEAALTRPPAFVYEPLVLHFPERRFRLLDIYTLLLAHTQTYSKMAHELRQTLDTLTRRTTELEQANQAISRHAVQLSTSSQVGQQVTSILDLDKLLSRVVHLIQSRFDYYFVGVWLLDENQQEVVLQAMAGQTEDRPFQEGFRIDLDAADITAQACLTGEPQLIDSLYQSPDYLATTNLPHTQSSLALPLHLGHQTIGVLDIRSDEPETFGSEEMMVLQILANQIAIAINNARLYRQEQNRRHLAEVLEQSGRALTSNLDISQVSCAILEQLDRVVPYNRGAVFLLDPDQQMLYPLTYRGFPPHTTPEQLHIQLQSGNFFEQVAGTESGLIIADVNRQPGWQQLDWLPLDHSWMGVPLISKDEAIGFISLTNSEVGAFTPEDATLVRAFAGQAAIALDNAHLYDEITQLNEHLEQKVEERTQELNRAYHSLERMDRAKADFINVTSHELRTPLTVIKGYTQLMKTTAMGQGDEKSTELINGILTGTQRMYEIVNAMLDVTRIDNEELDLYKTEVALDSLIGQIRTKLQPTLADRKLSLSFDNLANLPLIQADEDLLYKAFYQLIINAVKYTPDNGQITVAGRLIEPDQVEIIIRDTGIGIEPDQLELIFEKFYQTGEVALHSSGKTKYKGGGPGLGLAIVRGIIQAHGGCIWAESPGQDEAQLPGSRFYIRLPQ